MQHPHQSRNSPQSQVAFRVSPSITISRTLSIALRAAAISVRLIAVQINCFQMFQGIDYVEGAVFGQGQGLFPGNHRRTVQQSKGFIRPTRSRKREG